MIGSDTKMSGAFFDHCKYGCEHTPNRRHFLAVAVTHRGKGVVVAKEFVGSID